MNLKDVFELGRDYEYVVQREHGIAFVYGDKKGGWILDCLEEMKLILKKEGSLKDVVKGISNLIVELKKNTRSQILNLMIRMQRTLQKDLTSG